MKEKSIVDRRFFEEIKDAINNSIEIYTDKISATWFDSIPKQYEFAIEQVKSDKARNN